MEQEAIAPRFPGGNGKMKLKAKDPENEGVTWGRAESCWWRRGLIEVGGTEGSWRQFVWRTWDVMGEKLEDQQLSV